MQILGIANGTQDGNSEILLKAALTAATELDHSITTRWIHAPSVSIPRNPKPLKGSLDVSHGLNEGLQAGETTTDPIPDDRRAVLDAILDADALIISTPVYSHSPAGFLKAVVDRILGPMTDVTFAKRTLQAQKAGDPRFKDAKVDMRLLKPRVVGFMAIGGSTTPDQFALALPMLHLMVYSLHAKVVDQVVFEACGTSGLVVTHKDGAYVDRAQQLGRNVASQLGKPFDDAEYLGDEPPGSCPYCHLSKIELFGCTEKNEIGCNTCGALGQLEVGKDGVIRPVWRQNCDISSITEAGKLTHIKDLDTNGAREKAEMEADPDFGKKRQAWRDVKIQVVPLHSPT